MTEDEKIKQLFNNFTPRLGDDVEFMVSLRSKLEAAAYVKNEISRMKKRNRRAVVVASLAGVVAGVSLSHICDGLGVFSGLSLYARWLPISIDPDAVTTFLKWAFMAVATSIIGIHTYDLASVQRP